VERRDKIILQYISRKTNLHYLQTQSQTKANNKEENVYHEKTPTILLAGPCLINGKVRVVESTNSLFVLWVGGERNKGGLKANILKPKI
jgi:hypothetical protein